jgi:hypothetical protein
MNTQIAVKGISRLREWLVGMSGTLVLISVGLAGYAAQVYGQASVATLLLLLYLAAWAFVVGIIGLVFVAMWLLVESRPLAFIGSLREFSARQLVSGASIVPARVRRAVACRIPI